MLTLLDNGYDRTCQGYWRREFLRVGGLGLLGGLTLPALLQVRARAADAGLPVKDKAVVLLFLQGGPSHIEFFDPKMSAPAEVRSITGEVKTVLPGITFGGTFERLAKLADKFGGRPLLRLGQCGSQLSGSDQRRQFAQGGDGSTVCPRGGDHPHARECRPTFSCCRRRSSPA